MSTPEWLILLFFVSGMSGALLQFQPEISRYFHKVKVRGTFKEQSDND